MLRVFLFAVLLAAAFNARFDFVKADEGPADGPANLSPYELDVILSQLLNPSPEYQMQATALRRQLKKMLDNKPANTDYGGDEQQQQQQFVFDYEDYPVDGEDKRSVSALAAQGMLNQRTTNPSLASSSASIQLPTQESYDYGDDGADPAAAQEKRYIGALARAGRLQSYAGYGKRNIAMLARDQQLPKGKRNLATLARLGRLQPTPLSPKRNMAAVARYNSQLRRFNDAPDAVSATAAAEKRNIGALRGSPVHGYVQHKREDEEPFALPSGLSLQDINYSAAFAPPSYWMSPVSYADLDWGDYRRAQKRFLGRIFPPTRATASTHRSRL